MTAFRTHSEYLGKAVRIYPIPGEPQARISFR
jgi:hypothetical protein